MLESPDISDRTQLKYLQHTCLHMGIHWLVSDGLIVDHTHARAHFHKTHMLKRT